MKFSINTEAMIKGLVNLAKVIPARPVLPVLSNFLFELKGDELHLAAMDGEMILKTVVKAEGAEGEGCRPGIRRGTDTGGLKIEY